MRKNAISKRKAELRSSSNLREDASVLLKNIRVFLRSHAETFESQEAGKAFIYKIISEYWHQRFAGNTAFTLPSSPVDPVPLPRSISAKALEIGLVTASLDVIEASYLIGNVYTLTIPPSIRSRNGIYYTPPNLTARLLELCENAGVEWKTARVIDPACGGGAFLAPVALRIASSLEETNPAEVIRHLQTHLRGLEIDPFSAWLSQVFVEAAVSRLCIQAGIRLGSIIEIVDTLQHPVQHRYDLVIGNPPYGKTKLEKDTRQKYSASLYGHANLYGLFMHQAINMLDERGIVAFVTPTGFLGGEYFKRLREFVSSNGAPMEIDFVSARKGVFEDVLQETMLLTFKKGLSDYPASVNEVVSKSYKDYTVTKIDKFRLPVEKTAPWIFARDKKAVQLARAFNSMKTTLAGWGFEVNTGPLVWNRHKTQLSDRRLKNSLPLVWAEAVTPDGTFVWKADKRNHKPYFNLQGDKDKWLVVNKPCILMQRTSAKEQPRRLNTALLDEVLLKDYGGVVVENHLNIIRPNGKTQVSLELLNRFLRSRVVDEAFRCISGSVAVSAYELETLPVPSVEKMKKLESAHIQGVSDTEFEELVHSLYCLDA